MNSGWSWTLAYSIVDRPNRDREEAVLLAHRRLQPRSQLPFGSEEVLQLA